MTTTTAGLVFLAALIVALVAAHVPLGDYMYRVYSAKRHSRVERAIYRVIGANPDSEQTWGGYARSVLAFSAIGIVALFALQLTQGHLPLRLNDPATPMTAALAWNTAVSFVTNTNWQNYSGESTMSHLTQMTGLSVQNFVSAAVGMAVAVALVRSGHTGDGPGALLSPRMLWASLPDALRKLDPRTLWRNPVMLVVEIGAAWSTVLAIIDPSWFAALIVVWLWLTVVFANLAEAVAEGRGKAQAQSLRRAKTTTSARRLIDWKPGTPGYEEEVSAPLLRQGDIVVVEAGQTIPGDGDVLEGIASVDESAITGESAPVIRESGGDRSAVTGGTTVLSDRIIVRITQQPGQSFIDRMIALVEGANRQKTPNEIALNILLASLTIIFVFAVATLQPLAIYAKADNPGVADSAALTSDGLTGIVLVALLVCLIPTTIGALLSAIGIAGMDRLVQRNVLAMSGRAVEAAGDVNTLLLDKTGTITLGNRQAAAFVPLSEVSGAELADAAQLSSLADETPEGRSIVVFAKEEHGLRARTPGELTGAEWIPFSATTRMSGVDLDGGRQLRKGAAGTVAEWVRSHGGVVPAELGVLADRIAAGGGTPLAVGEHQDGAARVLGVVHLKDVVKHGMRERFDEMRRMGIRTVMITGDNPLTLYVRGYSGPIWRRRSSAHSSGSIAAPPGTPVTGWTGSRSTSAPPSRWPTPDCWNGCWPI
ncbi:potassium-transporting ATPase subunit KdpB [Mycolicibacterium brumae]|uniref:K(+)-transporting ATPase subunit B n=1 Tax=Mycolicibacterium brumae TaxID=85968 RepID=A0A2G5PEU1_9MYCO|nr:potassium-transporting ATPase subunit KdpB [Mycolicibacterium brumae]PIB76829.1 K(+)-transporting ATPase subunit B [Mycolicibacterium brumae]